MRKLHHCYKVGTLHIFSKVSYPAFKFFVKALRAYLAHLRYQLDPAGGDPRLLQHIEDVDKYRYSFLKVELLARW